MILDGVTALRVMHVGVEGYEAACAALRRTTLQDNPLAEAIVREIIADVRARGDAALLELGRRFDAPELSRLEVPPDEWSAAEETISSELREAMLRSAANVTAFHTKQRRTSWLDAQPDRITGQILRPLDRVGVYIPGGRAAYPSSVLMTAIPASWPGCRRL